MSYLHRRITATLVIIVALVGIGLVVWFARQTPANDRPLRVGLGPYQDMAILSLWNSFGIAERNQVRLELITLGWEELLPSVASAGPTVDVSFAGLHEYLAKWQALNGNTSDPVVFIFPTYVFKGTAFVAFHERALSLVGSMPLTKEKVTQFLSQRIAVQRFSTSHMMLVSLAERFGIDARAINIIDVPLDDGLLAAEAGSVDVAAVGLTQRAEALKRGGRVVLDMDVAGFADIGGLVCRQSTLNERREQIERLIRVWFDCVDQFKSNPEEGSAIVIAFLKGKAATDYTPTTLQEALSHEYFPRSVAEAEREFISPSGAFPLDRIAALVVQFLVDSGLVKTAPPLPRPISMSPLEAREYSGERPNG